MFIFFKNSVSLAQYTQPIPENFLNRMISDGKIWRAVFYDKVQVSSTPKPVDRGSITFKEGTIEIVDQNNKKVKLSYTVERGTVDPLLKTSDGKVYEVRFYNQPPSEAMRLRCVKSPDDLHYFEDITYIHM